MLQPDKDRLDFGTLLSPPAGFLLDKAIATSYTLDLDTLISIPIALCFSTTLELSVTDHIVEILEAVRRTSESIKIYCQKGQIKVPSNQHRLYSFIEKCIVQVNPTKDKSFHPKIWMLRFKNEDIIRYRVIVMSRNLTFDRSWDVVFQIEGDVQTERKNNYGQNRPIVDFANYLVKMEPEEWSNQFISDLGKTKFILEGDNIGFYDFQFLPFGIPKYNGTDLLSERFDQLSVVSPFISSGGITYLLEHCKTRPVMFSRAHELRKLKGPIKERLNIYHLDHGFVEAEEYIESDTAENADQQHQDLHAKIYCGKSGRNASLYLGSANCSYRALNSNVEFMVKISGADHKMGPKVLFDELINTGWFLKFDSTEELSDREEELCAREQLLQNLRIKFANIGIEADAVRQQEGTYSVFIKADLTEIAQQHLIDITAYLLNAENQAKPLSFEEINQWEVKNLAELDLSSFLIIRVHDRKLHYENEFTLKLAITGMPETRGNRIFTDIIANSSLFFRYLRFLLAENLWEEESYGQDGRPVLGADGTGQFLFQEEPIYENMLKAISREPRKLLEIKQVMAKISTEDHNDVPIIPADFKSLWEIFEKTLNTRNES